MTDLQWVGINLIDGKIVCDLPDIELTEQLAQTIGQYETTSVILHVETSTSSDWYQGTKPGASALIAWTGDPRSPVIIWGGYVQQRVRGLGNDVQLGLVTIEGYLEGCPVGTYNAASLNQDTILESLMAFAAGTNRVPITMNHLTASTTLQSVTYTPSSQANVYSALQALSGLANGPEWTMDWVWNLAAQTILPRMNYGARVGNPVPAGAAPAVTIEMNDLREGSAFTEDYSPSHGANDVIGWGAPDPSATSSDLPSVQATASDLKGRPLWTYSYQPDQTATTTAALVPFVTAAVNQLQDGAQPLAMVLPNDRPGKQFGVDWFLGDDLGWSLDGATFPTPVSGTARCIGYRADTQTISPTLQGASLG